LGTERALVVSGRDGLGEVTLADVTDVTQIQRDRLDEFTWSPEDFGLERTALESIHVADPDESAKMVRGVLAGEPGPARDIVVLNAAAGLLAAGRSAAPQEAAQLAAEAIDDRSTADLLERLAQLSHESV
jgi:anthranilate phosphoribosyltransferase